MLRLSLLWGFALILMPALFIQGWWVRKRAIRNGPAEGPSQGFLPEEGHQNRTRDGAVAFGPLIQGPIAAVNCEPVHPIARFPFLKELDPQAVEDRHLKPGA